MYAGTIFSLIADPELDIDRTYELMNEKRDRIQFRPHQQLAPKPTANDDDEVGKESRLGGDSQRPRSADGGTAATAVDGRSVVVVPPSRAAVAVLPNATTGRLQAYVIDSCTFSRGVCSSCR